MKLSDLLKYNRIVIQTHDNPDADAIASGYGVYLYLKEKGKEVSLVYGGKNFIRKSNLSRMVEKLEIPIEHINKLPECDLLLTVDCQYGEGNVTLFEKDEIAVIDHHVVTSPLPKLSEVRSNLGACATLIWDMLYDEGFPVNDNKNLATALYYGLYMDTGALAELSHPMDRDLRDQANFDENLIAVLRNSNMSIEELEIAGTALLRTDLMEEYHCAIVKANQCDPNILGIISDLVLEVDVVDVCVVFSVQPNGVKFSVRSCTREVMADELAEAISRGIGSGGGHLQKAGGFLQRDLILPEYLSICEMNNLKPRLEDLGDGKPGNLTASGCKTLIEYRIQDYYDNTMIIYANEFKKNDMPFLEYCRKDIAYGYVLSTDLFPVGTKVRVRSIDDDDLMITVQEQMVFIIGSHGDVNAMSLPMFKAYYRTEDWKFELNSAEYIPTIRLDQEGSSSNSLIELAKVCIPIGNDSVSAVQLVQDIKLFDVWDDKGYRKGEAGDYLIMKRNSEHDLVIVEKEIFEERFELRETREENAVEAVVFDLDGTLLDTLQDLANAVNYALDYINEPKISIEEVCQNLGNGVRLLMSRSIRNGEDHPLFERALHEFKENYKEHSLDFTAPYDGIMELLGELQARGIKIAVVSNKLDVAVKALCKHYFDGYVETAIGEREGVKKKPAPDSVMEALKELGVGPENAYYVGDSDVDIKTADNAAMRCISVTWGFRDSHFLKEHGATHLIDTPSELLNYL